MTQLIRLATLEKATRFNRCVFEKICPYLGKNILEVGMGIGIFTQWFLESASVVGVDVVEEFLEVAQQRLAGIANLQMGKWDVNEPPPAFVNAQRYDTVVCMNVLEHVKNDTQALEHLHRLLLPSGNLILVVPAYPWLYNPLDSNDGHYRRYRIRELIDQVGHVGFEVAHNERFNLLGILGWWVNGSLLRRKDLPPNQMGLFDSIAPLVFKLEKWAGPPAGLSIMIVGRKSAARQAHASGQSSQTADG